MSTTEQSRPIVYVIFAQLQAVPVFQLDDVKVKPRGLRDGSYCKHDLVGIMPFSTNLGRHLP